MAKISLQREEKLAICIQKYPALYNKAEPSFHNKNKKANAWSKIAIELGMESGKEAKVMFTSLRTKYNRCKKNFKDVNRSGTSSDKVQKAEKDLKEYAFLFWLDNFIYKRKGRSNLPQEESTDRDENISMETLYVNWKITQNHLIKMKMQLVPQTYKLCLYISATYQSRLRKYHT